MEFVQQPLPGLWVIKPKVFEDARGHFFESFREDIWTKNNIDVRYVQDNQSLSAKGILRGLHFQSPPFDQDKLVRVIRGKVLDVALDIRKDSPTYGQHFSLVLSGENFLQLFIPKGFAHGFETLEDDTIFSYKCSNYYYPQSEGGIAWNSPGIDIPWQTPSPVLSEKDRNNPQFADFNSPF